MTVHCVMCQQLAEAGVSAACLTALEETVHEQTYDAGQYVLRQGEHAPNVFYLASGLVKLVYITAEGNEFIKSFIAEGNFFGSLVSQLKDGESTFSIICLELSRIEAVPYMALQDLAARDPAMLRFSSVYFQSLALKKEIREFEFLCLSPTERYKKFLDDNPAIAGRVTQAEIARYLGITPVALSRIRARQRSAPN